MAYCKNDVRHYLNNIRHCLKDIRHCFYYFGHLKIRCLTVFLRDASEFKFGGPEFLRDAVSEKQAPMQVFASGLGVRQLFFISS